jgi:hypothetical protein
MTQEDIIKLAQEAGLIRAGEHYTEPARWGISEITDFYQRAVAAEREACAKLCLEEANEAYHQEAFYLPRGNQGLLRIAEGAKRCAEAIRARGEQ